MTTPMSDLTRAHVMRLYLRPIARFAAWAFLAFIAYRLLSLGLARPWGPTVYGFVVGSMFGDLSLILTLAAAFGGAAAARAGVSLRSVIGPAALVAILVTVMDAVLSPVLQHQAVVHILGTPRPGGPRFPWEGLARAAETRLYGRPLDALPDGLYIANLMALNAWTPLWIFVVAMVNGLNGFLVGRIHGTFPLSTRAWIVTLVSGAGFLGGMTLAIALARAEAAPLWVAGVLPTLVPLACLISLIAASPATEGRG